MHIISKLPDAGTTVFTIMSSLAVQHQAINLGQGFPDYPMNDHLVSMVHEAMQNGHNQYAHMNGYLPLREAICEKISFLYGVDIDPAAEVTITPGATYALYTALTTILHPGDEVIVFEPAYDSYIPAIELNGAVPVTIPLQFPGYAIDWNEVQQKITERTKAIFINNPHNPTGSVLRREDIQALRKVVHDTGIFIISDEVYEHLVFDGLSHESILRYPDLLERSFVCFSFGKVYHCTGWKMGYCISPGNMMSEFRKVHQFNAFTTNTPIQVALSAFLKEREHYLDLGRFFQEKRDYFLQLMKQTRFEPLPTSGSYFQVYSYGRISEEPEMDFATRITKEQGVATIPVSAFYRHPQNHQVVRFCFAKKHSTLEAAVERLVTV